MASIEHALGVFRENAAHSLRILKIFREKQAAKMKMASEDYSPSRFLRYNQNFFYTAPFYKLQSLVGKEGSIFYVQTQDLFAFVEKTTNFSEYDLCTAIKEFVEGDKITADAVALYEGYMKLIEGYFKESEKYYALVGELQRIGYLMETNFIQYKDLENFQHRKEVQESLKRIKDHFKV